MPKAHLKADAGLNFEYVLAKELHMTHKRLMQELDPEEIAYWRATFELEHEHYNDARARAEMDARAKAGERSPVPWRPQPNS